MAAYEKGNLYQDENRQYRHDRLDGFFLLFQRAKLFEFRVFINNTEAFRMPVDRH
jgi:hypothetical protein